MVDVAFRPRASFDLPSETNCRLLTSRRLPSAASALALCNLAACSYVPSFFYLFRMHNSRLLLLRVSVGFSLIAFIVRILHDGHSNKPGRILWHDAIRIWRDVVFANKIVKCTCAIFGENAIRHMRSRASARFLRRSNVILEFCKSFKIMRGMCLR